MLAATLVAANVMVIGLLLVAPQAGAAVSYSYVTEQPLYPTPFPPGAPLTVKLYLLETLTGGSPSLINADGGLRSVGVRVVRTSGGNGMMLAGATPNTADFGSTTTVEATTTLARFQAAVGGAAGVPTGNSGGNPANARASTVYLGSVTILATDPLQSATFALLPYDGLPGKTLTLGNSYDLDFDSGSPAFTGASSNPTSFVIFVPEPGPVMLLAIGAAAALTRRRRRA